VHLVIYSFTNPVSKKRVDCTERTERISLHIYMIYTEAFDFEQMADSAMPGLVSDALANIAG